MSTKTKKRNPRVVIAEHLAGIRAQLNWAVSRWRGVGREIHDGQGSWRKRERPEYPENNAAELRALLEVTSNIRRYCNAIDETARAELLRLTDENPPA